MLCNTNLSISLKDEIGQYKMADFNLFQINNIDDKFENLHIYLTNNTGIEIKVKCPVCHRYHCYKFKISDFKMSKMFLAGCEYSGISILFIGNKQKISETINRYRKIENMVHTMIQV